MGLPMKLPNDADVTAEDAARFRALTPEARVRTLEEMFHLYHLLASISSRPEAIARLAQEDEQRGRKTIEEFMARHV